MLRPFFPELVMSTDLLSFEHPSVLLLCSLFTPFYILHTRNNTTLTVLMTNISQSWIPLQYAHILRCYKTRKIISLFRRISSRRALK